MTDQDNLIQTGLRLFGAISYLVLTLIAFVANLLLLIVMYRVRENTYLGLGLTGKIFPFPESRIPDYFPPKMAILAMSKFTIQFPREKISRFKKLNYCQKRLKMELFRNFFQK